MSRKCIIFLALLGSCCRGQTMEEYQVKAAYILNVAKFIDWPNEDNRTSSEPFTICIIGLNPFGHWLDDSIGVESPKGRRLDVRRIASVRQSGGCRIIFLSSSERKQFASILGALDDRNVLTMGDCDEARAAGVAVNFIRSGTRVRFEINVEAAKKRGLRISPRLLSLATIVSTPM